MKSNNNKKRNMHNHTTNAKSKKHYGRSKNMDTKMQRDESCDHVSDVVNDASYYTSAESTELTAQLNNYTFNEFAGVPIDFGSYGGNNVQYSVGNIMQIRLDPSTSFTSDINPGADGVNITGLRTYTYLSATNGKTTNYAPQDVTLLVLAIANVLSSLSFGARGLGMVYTYNQRNRAYPEIAVQACGFDINDLKTNLANYRAQYNYTIQKFNKIPIPANIKLFDKSVKMFNGIYLDEEGSSMAQSYAFVPNTFWVYDDAYNAQGGGLHSYTWRNRVYPDPNTGLFHLTSFQDYLDDVNLQIDALLNSSLLNYIYADILRIHTKDNVPLMKVGEIPDDYRILPNKVEELSIWLNNATIMGSPILTPESIGTHNYTRGNDVESDVNNNCIIHRPQFVHSSSGVNIPRLVNFKHSDPSVDEKIYAVRLHTKGKFVTNSGGTAQISEELYGLNDWYVVAINIASSWSGTNTEISSSIYFVPNEFANIPIAERNLSRMALISKFDWHPYLYYISDDGNVGHMPAILGDLQYYTKLENQQLKAMSDVAMLNLMSVI